MTFCVGRSAARRPRANEHRRQHCGERWLAAPLQLPDGTVKPRDRDSAGVGGLASNAMGNFCFDVTLSYRRLERPRRVAESM
jgi:hypothetical protein